MEHETLFPLLCETANGNKAAFAELYNLTSAQMYAVVLKMLKRPELADEAIQDAYIKIWHNAGQYQRGKGTVFTWMLSIARYRALDLMRYYNVRNEVDLSEDNHSPVSSEESALTDAEQEKLEACMGELEPAQRQAIHLAYVNGLSHQEVETHMASPLGTIKSWIRRGLQSLQRCLSL